MYKTFGTPFDAFWCCTGTGCEEYAKLNDSIYFHGDSSVYVNLFIPSKLEWKERGFTLRQTTKFPNEERVTFTVDKAPSKATSIKLRVPYWATKGVSVKINGEAQNSTASPSSYVALERTWKAGDVISVDMPMTLHLAPTPDDPKVQAAMYGPLVLAARLGTEGLTTSMIYGGSGPDDSDGYPLPTIELGQHDGDGVWFERVEGSQQYPLMFHTRGRGIRHTLVPLSLIVDERYSVYLRNQSKA